MNLTTVHCSTKIQTLIQQIRLGRDLGFMMMMALEWTQLHAGTKTLILEETKHVPYVIDPWIQSVHKYMVDNNIKIKVAGIMVKPLQRKGDQYLMEKAIASGLTIQELRDINNCRMFLNVTTLEEIRWNTFTAICI